PGPRSTTARSSRTRQPVRTARGRRRPTTTKTETDSATQPATATKTETSNEPEVKPSPGTEPAARPAPKKQDLPTATGTHWIIEQKDGTRIDHAMINVRRIMIDNGQIVIFFTSGRIQRVPMANVARMAIEP